LITLGAVVEIYAPDAIEIEFVTASVTGIDFGTLRSMSHN
jgi:hypothetical protein